LRTIPAATILKTHCMKTRNMEYENFSPPYSTLNLDEIRRETKRHSVMESAKGSPLHSPILNDTKDEGRQAFPRNVHLLVQKAIIKIARVYGHSTDNHLYLRNSQPARDQVRFSTTIFSWTLTGTCPIFCFSNAHLFHNRQTLTAALNTQNSS